MSNDQFMTIKEASEKYGKAEITIRRLIRNVVKEESNEDRNHIQPSPAEVKKLKKKSKPFTYTVNSLLLDKAYQTTKKVAAARSAKASDAMQGEYYELMKEQLKVKDDQIRALNQSLDEMTVRSRETNILMKGLQEKLLIGTGAQNVIDADSTPSKKKGWKFW